MADRLEPGLHIVATPIGNLGDLSPRAADALSRADLILAEDTRVTGKLLRHIGRKTVMRRFFNACIVSMLTATSRRILGEYPQIVAGRRHSTFIRSW